MNRTALLAALTLGACTPAPPPCDYLNHSGVCETYAALSPELLIYVDSLYSSDPGGDIDLSATPHIEPAGMHAAKGTR